MANVVATLKKTHQYHLKLFRNKEVVTKKANSSNSMIFEAFLHLYVDLDGVHK